MVIEKINSEMSKKVEQQTISVFERDLENMMQKIRLPQDPNQLENELDPYMTKAGVYDLIYGTNSVDVLLYAKGLYKIAKEKKNTMLGEELGIPLVHMKETLDERLENIGGRRTRRKVLKNFNVAYNLIIDYTRELKS